MAGLRHREQRSRARALQRHRRPAQVELVGNPRGHEIVQRAEQLRIGGDLKFRGEAFDRCAVGADVTQEIGVHRTAGEHADQPLIALRVITGVLQRLDTDFQEQPLLGVGQRRFARRHAEIISVEQFDIVDDRTRRHIIGAGAGRLVESILQLGARKVLGGGTPGKEIVPELIDGPRARKAARQSDDGKTWRILPTA